MRYSRPVRLIFGILILIAFGWYMAQWMTNSVMSNDVGRTEPRPAAAAPVEQAAPAETTIEAAPAPVEPTPVPPTSAPPRPEELVVNVLASSCHGDSFLTIHNSQLYIVRIPVPGFFAADLMNYEF